MLRDAWAIMPLERKISKACHVKQLDKLCAAMASSDARLAEVALDFEKDVKECGTGRHSLTSVVDRLVPKVADQLRSVPGSCWREIAGTLTRDQRVLDRLSWYFI